MRVPRGWSVLEASRSHHIPLVTASTRARRGGGGGVVERELAVMLVDFRWALKQRRPLPHDLLYGLDRFSQIVGDTARAGGGVPTQFMGDRVMVLFGLDVVAIEANQQALRAAAELDPHLAALCEQLQRGLGCRTGHVIHLHTGMAAVGETGDSVTRALTAVGDAIDVVRQLATRYEDAAARDDTASEAGRTVVSRAVCVGAQPALESLVWRELELADGRRIDVARVA